MQRDTGNWFWCLRWQSIVIYYNNSQAYEMMPAADAIGDNQRQQPKIAGII